MQPDPYSGTKGVKQISEDAWEVTVRVTSEFGDKAITFALRLEEPLQHSKLVFSPLLNQFFKGEDFRTRAVKISPGTISAVEQEMLKQILAWYKENYPICFDWLELSV